MSIKTSAVHRFIPVLIAAALIFAFVAQSPVLAQVAKKSVYRGNAKSKKYHNQSCRYFDCKNCVVVFATPDEARRNGYIACKICGG